MSNKTESIDQKSQKGICVSICIPLVVFAFSVVVWRPILVPYSYKFVKIVAFHIINDKQRSLDNELLLARKEWKFYQLERRFRQRWCQETNVRSRKNVAWLTVMVSDNFVVSALVLGNSIRTFSCHTNMIALISKDVSENTRKALQSVGWKTRLVEEMDCDWMDAKVGGDRNSGLFGRPLGHRIKGTHTRFHAWNYTDFSKMIYVDADYMLISNIDELFEIPEHFAAVPCSRPGVLDPCFNAGLLVFKPDLKTYQEIMKHWRETTEKDTCPTDQELLNEFYADSGWKELPYAYNIRRIIFLPMMSFHYACCRPPKPWTSECRPSREEASKFDGPIITVDDMTLLFWKNFYQLIQQYNLQNWWNNNVLHTPKRHQLAGGLLSE